MSSHLDEIYARRLTAQVKGHPNPFPQPELTLPPEYTRKGTRVGDLGYFHACGVFVYLLHLLKPADHPINQGQDIPPWFRPVSLPSGRIRGFRTGLQNQRFTSAEISVKEAQLGIQPGATLVPHVQVGPQLEFETYASEGAILVHPDGATTYLINSYGALQAYLEETAVEWYRFFNETMGYSIPNGSLCLVTECIKSQSWGIASFAERTHKTFLGLSFLAPGIGSSTVSYSWTGSHGYGISTKAKARETPDAPENQCTVIRGFRLSVKEPNILRPKWRTESVRIDGQKGIASSKSIPFGLRPGTTSPSSGQNSLASSNNNSPTSDGQEAGESTHVSALAERPDQPYHPLVEVNEYILNAHPTAVAVVTHDSQWVSLIVSESDEHSVPPAPELWKRLQTHGFVQKPNGVVVPTALPSHIHSPLSSPLVSSLDSSLSNMTSHQLEHISIGVAPPKENLYHHVPIDPDGSCGSSQQTNAGLISSSGSLNDDLGSLLVNKPLPLAPTSPVSLTLPYTNYGGPFSSSFDTPSVRPPVQPLTSLVDEINFFNAQDSTDKPALADANSDLLFSASNNSLPNSFEPSLDTLNLFPEESQFSYEIHLVRHHNHGSFIPISELYSTIQPIERQGLLSPIHLQVPSNYYNPQQYSTSTASCDVFQFMSQHSTGMPLHGTSPFNPEIDGDTLPSTDGHLHVPPNHLDPNQYFGRTTGMQLYVFRSRSCYGKPTRRQSDIVTSVGRSQSMGSRMPPRDSFRAPSRNLNTTSPDPHQSSPSSPSISKRDTTPLTVCTDLHLREELVKLYHLVQTGHELEPAESDWVNQMCKLHSEQILVFDPIVSPVVEQTADQLVVMKQRQGLTKVYRCFLCTDDLAAKHNFTRHFLSHYGIKLFKCDECGESPTVGSDLEHHKRQCERVHSKLEVEKIVHS